MLGVHACPDVDPAVPAAISKQCLRLNEGKTRAERLKSDQRMSVLTFVCISGRMSDGNRALNSRCLTENFAST